MSDKGWTMNQELRRFFFEPLRDNDTEVYENERGETALPAEPGGRRLAGIFVLHHTLLFIH